MALGERSSYCNRTEPCSSHAKLLNHDRVSTSLDSTRRQRLASTMLVFFSCSTYRVCISMWAAFFDGPAKAGPGGGGRGGARGVWCRKWFPAGGRVGGVGGSRRARREPASAPRVAPAPRGPDAGPNNQTEREMRRGATRGCRVRTVHKAQRPTYDQRADGE